MFDPMAGWREVLVTELRTAVDDAAAVQHLVDTSSPSAEKIVLMQDNLHTQKLASLYEAFPAETARRLIDKLAVPYTLKHGSWLNMAKPNRWRAILVSMTSPRVRPSMHEAF